MMHLLELIEMNLIAAEILLVMQLDLCKNIRQVISILICGFAFANGRSIPSVFSSLRKTKTQ